MKQMMLTLLIVLFGCSPKENESVLKDSSTWTPGTEMEIFRAKTPECNEYFLGFFGCKELTKTQSVNLDLSVVSGAESFKIARRVHLGYKFPCTASKVLRSYLDTKDGEIELTSTSQPEIRPIQFVTYQAVSSLKFSFPEHNAQIDSQCRMMLTSWFALPVIEDLQKTWDGIKKNLDLQRKFSLVMGNSPNQVQSVIAVMNVKNGLVKDRERLQSELLAATDSVEQAIIKASIFKLDQKIGDKNCGDSQPDCGLTLVQRNLESCSGTNCDSFIGEARNTIESALVQVKSERDALARFIEAERARIQRLNHAIDQNLESIGNEIEGDRNEV